jgi:ABC-type amino acid transport substrate-binding protein
MRRITSASMSALVALSLLTACGSGSTAERVAPASNLHLVTPGYLTIGTYGTGIPAIVVGPGDKVGGLDGALFNAFAKQHGLKIRLYQTTFASMILAVEQHKVDVGTYVFYTPERAKHVYYTDPFFISRAVAITLKSFPYRGPASLVGKKVGTVVGFVWAPYLQKWSAASTMLFPDQASAGQALLNGQIQAYINGEVALHTPPLTSSSQVTAHTLHPGDFGIPGSLLSNTAYNIVNCKDQALATALNQQLAEMHASGQWKQVLTRNGLTISDDVKLKVPPELC